MNTEETRRADRDGRTAPDDGGHGALPFDRREWALLNSEAQDSLRRQYGREARGHADD